MKKKAVVFLLITAMAATLGACGLTKEVAVSTTEEAASGTTVEVKSETVNATDLFTDRDLEQTADLSDAVTIEVEDQKDVTIDSAGVYVLTGQAEEMTVYVEAKDEDKVQLVLDGLTITNTDSPCIYVKNADKVFVTTTDQESSLAVTGAFRSDGDTNTDAVIFSKDDLVLSGTGTLSIKSSDNGVSSKDALKITGGTLRIDCEGSALEAHEVIGVSDGQITVTSCNDGLHAEDSDDETTGWIYIGGGTLDITASDDAIHATTIIQIDGGGLTLTAAEGIEATCIQINDGTIEIAASDDGINAASKSGAYTPAVTINGGEVTINMGEGDTDGIDSNGDITVNGGTISITGMSTFDYDGTASYNGGTIIENGQETNTITNQMMGGPGGMGFMGGMGNMNGEDFPNGENFQNGMNGPLGMGGPEMRNGQAQGNGRMQQ
ncbi:MAG: carbohydrate-binding domain-containing protein [Lachnospiraceae bacterium]|nr:carbohydrate-binding domain-containing protein [Lachnospiraceae bacterium]MBQ6442606.1 carbohydrate-binding domain-containing protein [Lachnospiraceae bacterium]